MAFNKDYICVWSGEGPSKHAGERFILGIWLYIVNSHLAVHFHYELSSNQPLLDFTLLEIVSHPLYIYIPLPSQISKGWQWFQVITTAGLHYCGPFLKGTVVPPQRASSYSTERLASFCFFPPSFFHTTTFLSQSQITHSRYDAFNDGWELGKNRNLTKTGCSLD